MEMLKKDTYFDAVKDGVCLVAIGASWCPDCQKIAPIMEMLGQEYAGKVKFFAVKFDEEEGLKEELKIQKIPTLIFYKNGKEVGERLIEPNSKPLIENGIKTALDA